MKSEQIDMLIDAWYILQDVADETQDPRIAPIMKRLHNLIDSELSE